MAIDDAKPRHDLPPFWDDALSLIKAAPIAYLATVSPSGQPRVRPVTPAYDGLTAYIATEPSAMMMRHVRGNPKVELLHWGQDFRHLHVIGHAAVVEDAETLDRIWHVFPYSLDDYFGDGKLEFGLIRIEPTRIEMTTLQEAATHQPARVWRPLAPARP